MSAGATLNILGDLLAQAEEIRSVRPDVAQRIEADAEALLALVPDLSVAEVAELLGQSRPTIHAWVRAAVLTAEEGQRRGLQISPRSVLLLIPAFLAWRAKGRPGRLLPLLRQWIQDEVEYQALLDEAAEEERAVLRARVRRVREASRSAEPSAAEAGHG